MSFSRDRFTWLAYLMLGYFAYLQTVIGPAMPFLRAELNLNYTWGGLHFSAFAAGMVGAGLVGDRIARRRGRRLTFWGGAAGMAAGAMMIALGHHLALTLGGALMMGLLGGLMLVSIQAGLSDHHGEQRAIALTESNLVASVCATLAPLCVGGLARTGAGWRAALWLMVGLGAVVAVAFRGTPIPSAAGVRGGSDLTRSAAAETTRVVTATAADLPSTGRLPRAFWIYWIAILLCVAAEWCLAFWGADFLENVAGLPRSTASTAMSLFFVAMVAGRFAGSRLARRVPSETLLLAALAMAGVGFPLFWLAPTAPLHVAGLFVTGLGVANLFPMGLSAATGTAATQADAASARVSLAGGLAILFAPLLLGGAADRIGIQAAFGVVIVLLAAAAGMAMWAARLIVRRAAEVRTADG